MKKPTQREIDRVVELHEVLKSYERKYAEVTARLKKLGPAVYGTPARGLIVSKQQRETVDWDTITRKLKIPARTITRHTRATPYLRVDVLRKE